MGALTQKRQHDVKATEASESGVLIVSGVDPRGDMKYVRPDANVGIVGYGIGGW